MRLFSYLKSYFLGDNHSSSGFSETPKEGKTLSHGAPSADKTIVEDLSWLENNEKLFHQLEDKYYQYFIGVNSLLESDLNPFEVEVINLLNQTLQRDESLADEIPRLPDIVPKLIHLFKNKEFTWKEASDLIIQDPVLLVGVINVANSPYYNLNVREEQLQHVLSQLGLLEVRRIVMKVALKPIMLFDGGHFLKHSGSKIWEHSVQSAEACFQLAGTHKENQFDAYLAGLIHNLGVLIVVQKMNEIKDFKDVPRSIKFKNEVLNYSKKLSVKIADNWEISPVVRHALSEQLNTDKKKIISPLGHMLFEATAISMKLILVREKRWQVNDESTNTKGEEAIFDQIYKKLESMSLS